MANDGKYGSRYIHGDSRQHPGQDCWYHTDVWHSWGKRIFEGEKMNKYEDEIKTLYIIYLLVKFWLIGFMVGVLVMIE